MCTTCNGTGGITIQHTWGAEIYPCKNPNCDYDRQAAQRETDEVMRRMTAEIMAREVS
jgi:hypothetical protein